MLPNSLDIFFPNIDNLLRELKAEIEQQQPRDVLQHCANFFDKKLQTQRISLLTLGITLYIIALYLN
jgi:hypothetical protein